MTKGHREDESDEDSEPIAVTAKRRRVADYREMPWFNLSFKESEELSLAFLRTGNKPQLLTKPSHEQKPASELGNATEEHKAQKSKQMKELIDKRKAVGLSRNGNVLPDTKVLLKEVRGQAIHEHAWFHGIPHLLTGSFPDALVKELKGIESEIKIICGENIQKHKWGANGGVNLGNSIASGGTHARGGKSGSIHCAKALKNRPELRKQLYTLIGQILDCAYGKKPWYKRVKHLCEKLNTDSKEQRTIPGTGISGIWFSMAPKQEQVHCDRNICGAIATLSTSDVREGVATLCTQTKAGNHYRYELTPGKIVAGTWANRGHCNLNVSESTKAFRTSWTLYLDERVFGSNYVHVCPKGFKK